MDRITERVIDRTTERTADRTTERRSLDLLGPLLGDFQLLGDGVDRLVAAVRPAPHAA